jgi:two-component system OmpR family response regulator
MRILLVEDDDQLSAAMSAALREDGYVVDVADSKKMALAALDAAGYDLAILDIGLPDGSGFEIVRYLRRRNSGVPVLILTARDAVEDKVRGLDLGADDYLIKPIARKELAARARALIRRGHCGASPTLRAGGLDLDTVGRQAFHQGQPVPLTAREWGALEYLASRAGRIVAKEQLLQSLCGWERDITVNAVEMTIHRLRTRVEPYGVKIRTVRGLGYLLARDE